MPRIVNSGPVLLGFDLAIEITGHTLELGDHALLICATLRRLSST